jgi:hypothetical protein
VSGEIFFTATSRTIAAFDMAQLNSCHVKLLFGSYDRFLALLEDAGKRQYLKGLRPEAFGKDEVFRMARDISHEFQEGLIQLFFKSHDDLSKLTMKYGVF